MRYQVEFQYMPKGARRPLDDGRAVDIRLNNAAEFALLPNVGDFVDVQNPEGKGAKFSGRVRTRAFFYVRLSDDSVTCMISIVVGETDDNWGQLIKE